MIPAGGHCNRLRRPTLPPFSNKTLHHPSFQPLYVVSSQAHHNQTVLPIITPAELFYTDPTMAYGRRIHYSVGQLKVLDCFQLNTPPPLMSACLAPTARPDPFRSAPHPTMDLGSLTLKVNSPLPHVQQSCLILQLTQEEDQAVTNLLKLHHQEAGKSEETIQPLHSSETSVRNNVGRCWSDKELEAAKTLLRGFGLVEEDKMGSKNIAGVPSDTLPDLPHGSETLSAVITPECTKEDMTFCDAQKDGEQCCRDILSKNRPSISEGFPEGNTQTLSESEGDAVHVLLSLADMAVLVQ
ncbi:uncharacterized protein LOC121505074 [Cheilinus undulatus]|uniref:uncharacterized protein LOC121505074 n=1 Tax=Cheilinus undulatus TaxID=241271 RepID=UPI001BD6DA69|nr:uncharacterized protein LOC121505074 [Cheilinus undulatus]